MPSFGHTTKNPDGSTTKQAGFANEALFGSLTQVFDRKGVTQSTTLDAGASALSNGTGVSANLHHQMGAGGVASVKGQVGLVHDPDHQVTAWAQHQRSLNKNLKVVGPPTNSAGLDYQNSNGAGAFVSGSKTTGFPTVGTVGGTVPVFSGNGGNTNVGLNAQSSFARGMRPNHSVGLTFSHRF